MPLQHSKELFQTNGMSFLEAFLKQMPSQHLKAFFKTNIMN